MDSNGQKNFGEEAAAIAQSLAVVPKAWRRNRLSASAVKVILIVLAIAIVMPSPWLMACACSEVVVGSGTVTSSMSVDDEKGNLELVQSDISLPGVIPIELTRVYESDSTAFEIFGCGWITTLVAHMKTTTGDIQIILNGREEKFFAAQGYGNKKKDKKLSFTGPDEVTVEDRSGEKWLFNTTDRSLIKYVDRNGNERTYTWKIVAKLVHPGISENIFCPLTVTYPDGQQLTFSYDTTGDYQYLCREATSPSGFTVSYTYTTDGLLTGISKSNGQVLSYDYHKLSDSTKTLSWLTKITYANAAEVNIGYNGAYTGGMNDLKVTSVTGPEGYSHTYDYQEIPGETIDGPLMEGGGNGPQYTLPSTYITTLTDSLSHTTTYWKGPASSTVNPLELKKVTDGLGYTSETTKNTDFLPASIKNRRGKTTTLTYDSSNTDPLARSNLLALKNPLNKTWNYTWDTNRKLTQVKDPLNQEVNMTYDTNGKLLTVENGLAQTILTATYTTRGELATVKDGRNNTTALDYNTHGYLTKITDAAGKESTFGYDGAGNLLTTTNPLGKVWTNTYNGFYKLATSEDPLGNTTAFTYDEMANLTKVEDANGNETERTYDKLQRIASIKDALNNTTSFTYDTETNLTKLTDALGHEYSYTFDAVNQTKTFGFPGGSQESYDYDPNGNLTKLTNRAGQEITFTYDDADRVTQKEYAVTSGTSTTFDYAYDDADRLTGITRKYGSTTESSISYDYDAANQVTSVTADGNTVAYAYDLSQNVNQITYPSSTVVKYDYDSRNLPSVIKTGSNSAIATYTRDDAGRVTKRALANGLETVYTWNDTNWITKIELRETATPSNVVQSFEYGYDAVGNRLWVKNKDGKGDVYKYDAAYQVIGVKYGVDDPMVGYDSATNPSRVVTYTYDAVGNRTSVTDAGSSTTYTTNNLNQYTAVGGTNYTYSTRGDLTGDGTWTYGYDNEGHLINASKTGVTAAYKYDTMGRRIEKNVNGTVTKYVYNGYDLIEERDGSGSVTMKYFYEKGIDRPVKVIKGADEYYFQQDALGNVTALTDGAGLIAEQYTYDIFGKPAIKDGSGSVKMTALTSLLFTGREYDAETNIYHVRNRTYFPKLGRWFNQDPASFYGGVNLYSYCLNNPIDRVDPFGYSPGCFMGRSFARSHGASEKQIDEMFPKPTWAQTFMGPLSLFGVAGIVAAGPSAAAYANTTALEAALVGGYASRRTYEAALNNADKVVAAVNALGELTMGYGLPSPPNPNLPSLFGAAGAALKGSLEDGSGDASCGCNDKN